MSIVPIFYSKGDIIFKIKISLILIERKGRSGKRQAPTKKKPLLHTAPTTQIIQSNWSLKQRDKKQNANSYTPIKKTGGHGIQ